MSEFTLEEILDLAESQRPSFEKIERLAIFYLTCGCIIGGSEQDRLTLMSLISPEFFGSKIRSYIYMLIVDHYLKYQHFDSVSVAEHIHLNSKDKKEYKDCSPEYLSIFESNQSYESLLVSPEYIAGKLKEGYYRRETYQAALFALQMACDLDNPEYIKNTMDFLMKVITEFTKTSLNTPEQDLNEAHQKQLQICRGGLSQIGWNTGFSSWDKLTGGLVPGRLIILAARPSMGKTALALRLCLTQAKEGSAVFIGSYELTRPDVYRRLLVLEAGSSTQEFKINEARKTLEKLPIYINDNTKLSLGEINAEISSIKAKHGEKVFACVDYLQKMPVSGKENRSYQIEDNSWGLKQIAKQHKIPVMALCQLSRSVEARQDKKPFLGDLKDSGAIEQDADDVAMIYRDEYYNKDTDRAGIADIIIAKCRDGQKGEFPLVFIPFRADFSELGVSAA